MCLLFTNNAAWAQDAPTPADTARFRVGALRFTPSIAVTSVGIDNNVFNEVDDPKRDTTAAVGPGVALWLKLGKGRFSGKTAGQYLYFKEYANQRAWNTNSDALLELPTAHLAPFIGGAYINSRERPGFEIDSRSRRRDQTLTLGTSVRFSPKTTLIISGSRAQLRYDQSETFLGSDLSTALDRRGDTEHVELRYALTPLTTLVVIADSMQDRFITADTRDADSIRVMPGFDLKPFALISGKVAVGFRHFNMLQDGAADFDGLVAAVNARYVLGPTQFAVRANRDVVYSFETTSPYYALTDLGLDITERITHSWDVVARGGRQSLAYRKAVATSTLPGRTDRGVMYGAGLGYRLGESVRLGVDANVYRRDSQASVRNYEGLRIGASVSYATPQGLP